MTIAFRDLATLNVDGVQQRLVQIQARLQEQFPTLFLQRGVFHDTSEMIAAILEEQLNENVSDYLNARSLMDILADPTISDADAVDAVLSNFRVVRQPGAAATGSVAIVVADDTTVTIAGGSTFTARGLTFTANSVFSARVEEDQVIRSSDRLLTPTGDGNWQFTIDVTCTTDGSAGNVLKDELVIPDVLPQGYVTSYAISDFAGGIDAETNADLVARLQQGLATPGLANQGNFAALLRTTPAFARFTAQSPAGYGDPEMLRDKHSIFPVGMGGRVDWYVRTQAQFARLTLTKTAVLVHKTGNIGTWQISLLRDDAPGYYEVESVLLPGSGAIGTFALQSELRGTDFAVDTWHPDIITPLESNFSRYQTAIVQFVDTVTDVSAMPTGSMMDYEVVVKVMPQIADVQDMVASDTGRSRAGDYLVKAPIPCFVVVQFTIVKQPGQADPDLEAVADAVSNAVNAVGFTGFLSASVVLAAASPLLLPGQTVQGMDLVGRIVYPDLSNVTVHDSETLIVPEAPAVMVGARTVQFFLEPTDVNINTV